jgi:hypothetical protein
MDNQGPVLMVWDGMFPGEQERGKTIISGETDFLEQFGMRLDGIQQKGPKVQRTSEGKSRGGFTRRRGWYRTNDIRTTVSDRDMEIWIPKDSGGYSRDDVESVWDTCRNDTQKDEYRVQLKGPEKEWWSDTELGLL